MQNLGVIAAARGDHRSAIGLFDQAIAADASYVSAHYNRAVALMALGHVPEAIKGFSRVCALEPEHYEAHRALGFLWLSTGERGRSLDHFARTYELRRGADRLGIAAKSLTMTTRDKLLHDAEQFRYLSQLRRDRLRFETLARNYEAVAKEISEQPAALSAQQREMLGEDYNTAIHIRGAPELAARAVSERSDREVLTERFQNDGAVYFDHVLTPPALLDLQRYLLESTIWHDFTHIGGFVAAYLEDGLACPLLLQIADEMRSAFPEVLRTQPLSQAWVFKGLRPSAAVDVHADDAAVSVNLWVTPSAANLNPSRGGLRIGLAPPPSAWEIKDYDEDRQRIVAFLEQNADDRLYVPYRENRAVLFKSRLFHYSDLPQFALSYENHRLNVTFLFGGRAR